MYSDSVGGGVSAPHLLLLRKVYVGPFLFPVHSPWTWRLHLWPISWNRLKTRHGKVLTHKSTYLAQATKAKAQLYIDIQLLNMFRKAVHAKITLHEDIAYFPLSFIEYIYIKSFK